MWTRGNPFTPSSGFVKLHNLFTEGSVSDMAGERLPHFSENNKLRYEFFWQECFIDKTKSLSSILLFLIIGHYQPHRKNKSQRRSKLSKNVAQAQSSMDILNSSQITTSEIFWYFTHMVCLILYLYLIVIFPANL